ncbi:MAG: ribosome silencing factor [Clostridia bacterium]|nr:ribosome silencing factor [Clostridia bacterium]
MHEDNKVRESLVHADGEKVARTMADVLWEKQAVDTELYQVSTTTIIADYYLIATGKSSTHVKSLADELLYEMELRGITDARVEGRSGAAWILIDFGNVIVHIFDRASRDYYHLEHLLGEEQRMELYFPTPEEA